MRKKTRLPFPIFITLLYVVTGGVWVFISHQVIRNLITDPNAISLAQIIAGGIFVAVTGFLLFIVVKREYDTREKAEEEYRIIFENNPQGFFQFTSQGRFLNVNPAMAHIFGFDSPEEMIAQVTDINTHLHLSWENWKVFVDRLFRDGSVLNYEAQNFRKDGSLIWTSTNARVVRDRNGEVLYYEGFLQDITQRKQAEQALLESEWGFRGLYEHNPLILFNMDRKGIVQAANQTACQVLGYLAEELVGQHAIHLVHEEDRQRIIKTAFECIKNPNKVFQLEFRARAKSGDLIWVEGSARAFLDKNNQFNIFVVCEDIHERKQAELNLVLAEQRYRALVEQSPVAVYREEYKKENQHLYLSPQIERILGYTAEELTKHPEIWRNAIHPEDRAQVLAENVRTDETLEPFQIEYRAIKKDGSVVWLRDQAIAICAEDGTPQYWQGVLMDITEQKKVQTSLLDSEISYRRLFDSVTDAIYIQNADGVFLDVNEGAVRMYGYTREELIGMTPEDVSAPGRNDMEKVGRHIQLAIQGEAQQFEFWGRRKDGEIFPKNVRVAKGSYFGNDVLIVFAEDITERKKAEEALRTAEARYRTLVEHLPAVVYIDSADEYKTTYISPQIEALIGYPPEAWITNPDLWNEHLHPDDRESIAAEEVQMVEKGLPLTREYRMVRSDGQIVWVYDHAVLVRDQEGVPLYYQGVLLDITKQHQAEEAIHQSEERFSKVFQASSIAICITTLDEGRFVDANQAYWDLFGRSPMESIGRTATELNIWKDESERNTRLTQLKRDKSLRGVEGKFLTASGSVRDALIFYELIRIGGQDCILSMFQDITAQKKAQDDLHRKESILDAIAFAADQFLKSPQWADNITAILETLGKSANASRVYIFEKLPEGAGTIAQRFEWCAPGITPFIDDKSMLSFDMAANGLGRWLEILSSGGPVYSLVADLPAEEQIEFKRLSILSILYMPIMVGEKWWGFIGLDDCVTPRAWSESEIEALRTAANIISAAIQRERSDTAVQKQVKELMMLHAVALANSTANDVDELIHRVTEIIHGNLVNDNCGVLVMNENRTHIAPHTSYIGLTQPEAWESQPLDMGVVGKVVTLRQPIRLGKVGQAAEYLPTSPNIHSEICVPILSGGEVVGAINIESTQKDAYNESDERLLNTIAGGLGAAIAKFKLFEAERQRTLDAENLRVATATLTNSLNLDDLFETTFDMLARFTPYDSASIFFLKGENIQIMAGRGLPQDPSLIGQEYPLTEKWERMYSTHHPLIIADAQTDPAFERWEGTEYIRGWMGLPLVVKDEIIGFINVDSRMPNFFTEDRAVLIQTFANQAAIAIENALLFEAEQRRRQEAETLREAATAVASTLDEDRAIQAILDQLSQVVPFESASVQILGDGYLEIVGGVGWPDLQAVKGMRFPVPGDNPNTTVILEQRPYILKNAPSEYGSFRDGPHSHIHSWLGVPLIVRDRLIGMLAVDHFEPNYYNEEHARLVETFAIQAAIAIENARLFASEQRQRLREASMLDLMRLAASSIDLDQVNHAILGHIIHLIPCDSGTIQILQGDRLRVSAAIGFEDESIKSGNTLLLDDFPINLQIVTNKESIRIGEVETDDRYRWIPGIRNIHSFMGVPIIFKGDVIGIATLDSAQPNRFTREDEELALAIANNAANAIGNVRLFEMEQRRRQEAENLRLAASAITSTLDARQVLETILTALQQVVPYYSATMFLLDNDVVRIAAAQGLSHVDEFLNRTFPADNRLFLAMRDNGNQPIILYDAQADPRFENWLALDVHGWMGVPLVTRGEIVGFITLDSDKAGTFDENSAALAQTFATQAAIAIENARLYEETRQRLEELEVVSRISFALRATQEPIHMLSMVMKEIQRVIGTEAASIWLYNPRTYTLDQVVASGWQADLSIKYLRPNESIVGHVYQTGETYFVQDFPQDAHAHPVLSAGVGAGWGGIVVPIRTTSQTIGALVVALPQPRKVEPPQVQLLSTLAEIVGSAIHRAQLYDQSEEQVRRLTALRDVDTAIASSFDLRVTINILLDHALAQLNVDAADIIIYNPELRTFNHLASLGFRQPSGLLQAPIRINSRLLNETMLARRDISIADIASETNFHRKEIAAQENFIGYFATPLVSKGQVKGILEVYLRRPLLPETSWVDFFHTIAGQAAIAIDNSQLFENLQRSNQELSLAYDTTLEGWGKALELRDKETQGHTVRVTDLTLRLARRMGIPESELIHVRRGVLLHDIGKMAVPDQILKKTGPLSADEWAEMRQHPKYAYDLLYPIAYLRPALDIPYAHHEFWNGAGYPRGLKGEDIPLAARIFAVVDVYDALLFDRPYRQAWPKKKVVDYLLSESETHFDPAVVHEFLKMIEEDERRQG